MAFFANGSLTNFGLVIPLSSNDQVSKDTSLATDPELIGPDRLCNVFGSVIGSFFGAGDPTTDVYSWKIFGPANQLLNELGPGGAGFQTINYTFSLSGTHRIELEVKRAGILIFKESKDMEVIQGPTVELKPIYSICTGQTFELQAISPSSPNFTDYVFEWRNENGDILGSNNTLSINKVGKYSVLLFFENSEGLKECEIELSTDVKLSSSFEIKGSQTNLCPDQSITYTSVPSVFGEWFYKKSGSPDRVSLGNGFNATITALYDLEGPGEYEIILSVNNETNPGCTQEASESLNYYPQPDFVFLSAKGSSGCLVADGAIRVQAITSIDQLEVDGVGIPNSAMAPGEIREVQGLKSGNYSVIGILGNCTNTFTSVVPLIDPPAQLEFEILNIEGEICTPTGKNPGSFLVKLINGGIDGTIRLLNEKGAVLREEAITDTQSEINITIPGGKYFFEIYDKDSCSLPKNDEVLVPSLSLVEYEIESTLSICQSFDLVPETSQPLEFTIIFPDNSQETKPAGEAFNLTKAGDYQIVGRIPNQSQICPTLKEFKVELVEPVDFEPLLKEQDCFGNRTFEANIFGRDPETVKFRWLNEENELVGIGQFLDLDPFSFGMYSLDVQPSNSNACPIPPKEFLIEEPILEVDVTLKSTQLCELGPGAIINLETTFFEEVTDIEWRRFNASGTIDNLPEFKNKTEITVFDSGIYEASVFSIIPSINKNCELGRNTIELAINPNKIDFTIPASLSICETYEFIPETTQDLTFEITYPNGETTTRQSGEPLILNQKGIYLFLGLSNDQVPTLCPEVKSMEVIINKKIPFTPELFQESCDGTKIYRANLGTTSPAIADFTWFDESGNIIGTSEFLTLNSYGNFALDVQPKGSIPCDQIPVPFFVETPVLQVPVSIFSDPLCPDASFTVITATSQFDLVNRIEWWFTDLNGIEKQLPSETDRKEILALEEGTYEVRIFNSLYCLLGFDKILVMRSMDTVRPEVKENYQVCPRYEIAETINPGQFASYEWYHEGILVSINPTYKPLLIGNYELIVFSAEGCAYQATFVTEEECELKVSFPNAIQPGNPDKQFLIYTNYLIDELEVFVFSKWGEVIFQCASSDLISEASTCPWDGTFAGKGIPPGSYAIRINFKNLEKNISKYYLGSVLVIE